MSDSREEAKIGKLVYDAVPDPPREANTYDDQSTNQNHLSSTAEKLSSKDDSKNSTNFDEVKNIKLKKKKTTTVTTEPSGGTINNWTIMNCNGLNIGTTTKYVYNNYRECSKSNSTKESAPSKVPPYAQTLLNIKTILSREDIDIMKIHIGRGWKTFSRQIGYSEKRIEQFLIDYEAKGISEVIYKICIDWTQSCGSNATLGQAVQALWASKEFECIEKLAEVHNLL